MIRFRNTNKHNFSLLCILLFFTTAAYTQDSLRVKTKDSVRTSALKIGGALRLNYNLSSWKPQQVKRGGDFGFDLFRINVKAKHKDVSLNAEYRLYSAAFGGGMLKQGWFGYNFKNNKTILQIGLTQVPFGNQTYNSNNWFFNLPYYLGFEDDHDMGLKLIHKTEHFKYHFAFFKNAEELKFGNTSTISPNRYSYDISGRNKEVNQANVKVDYLFGENKRSVVSVFGEYGGLYNVVTKAFGDHYAYGLSLNSKWNKLNLKAQIFSFEFRANDTIPNNGIIEMAAYGAPYNVAEAGKMFTFGIAYDVDLNWGPITNVTIYNDFAFFDKSKSSFTDSYMNVFGAMFTAGNVYTYVDFAMGKNHSWLGPNWTNSFSTGDPSEAWNLRFNINFGYYF
ncbi:MAG: hypothetical protein ACJASR_000304 [Psychroserpens sp.]|jgi:hypothetical protein